MKTRTRMKLWFAMAVILTTALIASPFFAGLINRTITNYPRVISGTADFSETTPMKMTTLYLEGKWEFFENEHIITNSATRKPILTQIPPKTLRDFNPISTSSGSNSSYRIRLENLDFQNALIFVPHLAGSYQIFINGESITRSGIFSDGGAKANLALNAVPFDFSGDSEYEIVIEVSCNLMPGLYMTPVIADYDYMYSYLSTARTIRCMIFGIVIFCGLYIFSYSLHKRSMYTSKWLPLLALFIGLRLMISTEGFTAFRTFFGSIDYEQMTLIICLSTYVIKLAALLFYNETLDLKVGKPTFILLASILLICAILLALFPYIVCTPFYYIIMQAAALPLDFVMLWRLSESVAKKVPYSLIYTLGYIAMTAGIMVDCFYTNGLIPFIASSFMPICFGFLVTTLTIIFAQKQTAIYLASLKSAKLDRELTLANTSVMISQIQPHFLYNALNTIKYLIKRDPKAAEKAVISFSSYLRGNMDSLTSNEPIPFLTELYHIKNYCDIELLRFGDKLNIVYNTDVTDFSVPALSIQPVVENAIKHGVTKKPEGGTVTISTYEDVNNYIITVIDNGIGFDRDNLVLEDDSQHAHVGIANVKKRLKTMINASFNIESTEGSGTYVTIKIPKEKEKG